MFEYFPGNYAWNMAVVTLVDEVGTISEPETAFRSVAHMSSGETKAATAAWFEAMTKLGSRLEAMGEADAARGRKFSASRKYHRAAMYFIRAERMAGHQHPLALTIYRRALANYRRARILGGDPIEFVTIPYKGGLMPALFLKGEGEGPRPTVIHLQGFDSIKETQYPYLGGYRQRGLSALIVDQPGTGEAIRLHGLTGEIETENYVSVLVDYLEGRQDVDASRIGLAGLSMGGYFAPRAAAFETRIKACAAWGAMHDAGALIKRAQGAPERSNSSLPNPYEHAMWCWGAATPAEAVAIMQRMTLKGIVDKLKCPLLVMHGENDRQVPLEQAEATFAEAGSAIKELKVFTVAEGGAEHCQLDNRYLGADFITDWFSEQLL